MIPKTVTGVFDVAEIGYTWYFFIPSHVPRPVAQRLIAQMGSLFLHKLDKGLS